jgi:hypothetical protein
VFEKEVAMIRLNLSAEERDILAATLECCVDDLKDEIRHTDRVEYREMLKHRLEVLSKVLEILRQKLPLAE